MWSVCVIAALALSLSRVPTRRLDTNQRSFKGGDDGPQSGSVKEKWHFFLFFFFFSFSFFIHIILLPTVKPFTRAKVGGNSLSGGNFLMVKYERTPPGMDERT